MKGSEIMDRKMKAALKEAVLAAIEEVGIERFKQTSLFMSNDQSRVEMKAAA